MTPSRPVLVLFWGLCAGFCLLLVSLYAATRMPDDIALMAIEMGGQPALDGEFRTYRYFTGAVRQIVWLFTPRFHDLMPLWTLTLVGGLLYASWTFCRYARLPWFCGPSLCVLVAAHGYSADLYNFPLAYLNFGSALIFVGMALHALSVRGKAGKAVAAAGAILCLFSYQPMAMLLLYAITLRLVMAGLNQGEPGNDPATLTRQAAAIIATFLLSVTVFFVTKGIAPQPDARDVATASIPRHLGSYLRTIIDPYLSMDWARIYPIHERVAHVFTLAAAVWLCVGTAIRTRALVPAAALVALLMALVISPGPFNLMAAGIFWPSPRSIWTFSFLQTGLLLALLVRLPLPRSLGRTLLAGAVTGLAFLSVGNHFHLSHHNHLQNKIDLDFARLAVLALREAGSIADNVPIAVHSGWGSSPQLKDHSFMDFGLSAFSQEWSNVNLLSLVAGVRFMRKQAPPEACVGRGEGTVVVETHGQLMVVCIP